MREFIVEADGGSRGNPGPAGYGSVVIDATTGETLVERAEFIGVATNNVAEYRGLVAGLRAARELDPSARVRVRMDSKLVVEQMSGRWKIKHPDMKPLAAEAARVLPPGQVSYEWIPREQNKHADRLANEAMDAGKRGEQWDEGASRAALDARSAPAPAAPEPSGPPGDAAAGAAKAREALARAPRSRATAERVAEAAAEAPADAAALRGGGAETVAEGVARGVAGTAAGNRMEAVTEGRSGAAEETSSEAVTEGRSAAVGETCRTTTAPGTRAEPVAEDVRRTVAEAVSEPRAKTGDDVRAARTVALSAADATAPAAAGPAAAPTVGWGAAPDLGAPATFVLLRHGETPLTPQKRFSGSGGTDPSLSDVGRGQAERVAAALARRGTVQHILASPLARTRETAGIVAARLGLEVTVEDGLIETDFGAWEGLTFGEVRERHPDDLNAWLADPEAEPTGGGESFAATAVRIAAARDRLVAAYAGRTVLLVTHVTPIKTLVRLALGAPPESLFRMELSAASLSAVAYYADGNASVRLFNETSHLRS
ncbi:bifunctional RNase H/acid phosphatase [Streptomyces sp. NBC_00199]|uniref:bifunctional RNase H/acid phosphatase n=1 Tax=Streptomyces sp. NBC_00199 TaxID=2975678 RepID=UPI002254ADE8|nr:bifunctional RNase H/acid phosphatase [Streptomyces sp. NBC_00199]MCX5269610.1 bifunctional RNase H/acid phosphatase [Streptomyces sp. NBC_00199]